MASSAEATNQTIIGYEATGVADNSVVLGNEDVTAVYMGEDSGATVYAAGLNIGGTEITSTATELNLLTGATSLGTGILSPVTENSNTGVRLSTAVAANHGDIGSNAVDLSYSSSASTTRGATGKTSTAMGDNTEASGSASTAMGASTTASEYASTAMGQSTTASGFYSTAMGRTTTASGYASTAMGFETTASGENSTAMGQSTTASGYASTAMGYETTASGSRSTAMGRYTTASGDRSTAMGDATEASGNASTAMGDETIASGYGSTAMGRITEASGTYSTAMGGGTTASGKASTAMGSNTEASGYASTAMGYLTTASDYGSLVIGQNNSSGSSATNADSFSTANTAFVIGNGADSSNISDAFSILFDGTTNIAGSVTATSFVGDGSGLTGITGNFVDLTTAQTIAGSKTFSSDISVNGVKIGRGIGDHSENTVVGSGALGTGTGQRNTALGRLALGSYSGSSFDNNTAVGYNNSSSVSTGQQNTSIGAEAMLHLTTGSANTAIGAQSLINTTGSNNTSLGYAAGQIITSGNNNTFLGKSSNGSSATLSNSSAIGYEATVAASNTIQLGNTSITDVKTSGTVTAGAVTYLNSVGTNGQVLTTDGAGATSWATPSTIATGYSGVLPIANGGTGSATQNFVDLTTAQTIAGAKTFSSDISVNGDTYVSNSLYLGGTEITSTATELNLLTGATSLGTGILSPVTENSNTGVRLSTAVAANHGDIGSNAVDLSYSSSASTTSGATGNSSTAMGNRTIASGSYSTAMGESTTASGYGSTAMGRNSIASGSRSTAMGDGTTASEFFSTAMGQSTTASGFFSTAMGGGTEASGGASTAMGASTTASDYGSLVIGQYNSSGSSATSANSFSTANTAFVIGNGTSTINKSDAFSILFDGTTIIAGSVTADSFIKDGGVSTEFLKADGSVDSSVYITAAEVTPQADSDWASTVSPTQILNKPTTISTQQADEITANTLKRSYPVLDEDKLATIETGAQVNVQSDWDATTGDALILNKPVIPTIVPQADSDWDSTVSPTQILNKPTTISTQQADEITANTLKRSYPVLDEDKLATIETGAQVNVQSDWDATTGDALILNKPVITDDQQLGNFILSAGSLLSIAIERGNGVSVNLAPLLADLEAENDDQQNTIDELTSIVSDQQALIEDLIIRMEIREECACDPTLGNGDNTLQPDKAYLLQNIPNPFNNTTSVGYFVPYTNAKAHIVISTMAGQIVHNMELSNLGVGAVSIDNSRMASAVYLYTLYVDGKRIDTKRMIVE